MNEFNRIAIALAISTGLFFLVLFSTPLRANDLTVNIQCNDCSADAQFQTAALNSLTDRQQAIVNVINFNRFEVRKYDVNKLDVEVCTDYTRSATKGFCKQEDYSSIQILPVTNLERERFFAFAEYLAEQDFFNTYRFKVNSQFATTAWELLLYEERSWDDIWKEKTSFIDIKLQVSQVISHSFQSNTPILNLSPIVEFEFVDQSTITAVVSHLDIKEAFGLTYLQLSDQNTNILSLNKASFFSIGDRFKFASMDCDSYKALYQKINNAGFTLAKRTHSIGIEVTLLACSSNSKPCVDVNALNAVSEAKEEVF